MRVIALLHAEFEVPGIIKDWFVSRGADFINVKLYANEQIPKDEYDVLLVMGGPMNIYEEKIYPWLRTEKIFIKEAIETGKRVLGICLGAQLIADVMGAKVYKNRVKEIGWYPVIREKGFSESYFFEEFPEELNVLQWHGDTFDIPEKCRKLAYSEACQNQAFEYDKRVIALQFHLEAEREMVKRMLDNCGNELVEGEYIQREGEIIIETKKKSEEANFYMIKILEKLV